MELYTVKAGDSLSKIAAAELGDGDRWKEIAKLNNIVDPNMIFPGAQLMLPETEKLQPITITQPRRGEPKTEPGAEPPPRAAGLGFDLTPETMMYLAGGALLLYLLVDRK